MLNQLSESSMPTSLVSQSVFAVPAHPCFWGWICVNRFAAVLALKLRQIKSAIVPLPIVFSAQAASVMLLITMTTSQFRTMQLAVLGLVRAKLKITQVVVARVFVNVMNDFFAGEKSLKVFFHDKAMLIDVALFVARGVIWTKQHRVITLIHSFFSSHKHRILQFLKTTTYILTC